MSHMYIVAYDDMFRSNSTIFRSLKLYNMQHIRQSARWDPIYKGWNFNSGNYLFTTDTK